MKRLGLIVLCGVLSGCGLVEVYVDGISNIFKTDRQRLDELALKWNAAIGTRSKDDQIKKAGPPERCATLKDGNEACLWRFGGVSGGGSYSNISGQGSSSVSSWEHRLTWTYDKDGIAREWSYGGSWGQRTSKDPAPTVAPSPPKTE